MPLVRAEFKRKHYQLRNVLKHDISQVLYLPFDYDDGNYARDRSGYNNHGTIYGATRVAGKVGDARSFDGVDDYVDTLLNPAEELGQEITALVWVYPTEQVNYKGVLGAYDANVGGFFIQYVAGWTFAVYHPDLTRTTKNIGDLTLNTWSHLGLVAKGGVNGYLKAYLNGVEVAPSPTLDKSLKHYSYFWVGRVFVGIERYFKGLIDEVRIYNRALSQAEIQRIMNMRGL